MGGKPAPDIRIVDRLSALIESYDALILDLWGVIHNGVTLFDGVADCLENARQAGKGVVFLSNAPRRAEIIAGQLEKFGIAQDLHNGVVSSGQHAYDHLSARDDPWYAALGWRCHHIGPPRDENMLGGLPLEIKDDPAEADFILNTGPWGDGDQVANYEDVLQSGARAGVPMICCNPDREVIRGGRRMICAGALADRYEELGGQVRYHGKPDPAIYPACLARLGVESTDRVLAVGDSLGTDIAGANAAGIDSLLVTGGLHAEALGLKEDEKPDAENLNELCRAKGHWPLYALPRFIW